MPSRIHELLSFAAGPGDRMRIRAAIYVLALGMPAAWLAFLGVEREATPGTVFFALVPAGDNSPSPQGTASYPAGSRLAHLSLQNPGESVQVLGDWTLASPPAFSYDGRRLLFAGRREADPFDRIWELHLDERFPRQAIRLDAPCATPYYLPNGRIVFSMEVEPEPAPVYSLFTCTADGSGLDRITYGRSRDRVVAVLEDGRVLFERALLREGGVPDEKRRLLAVFPDGTGLALYLAPFPPASPPLLSGSRPVSLPGPGGNESALYQVQPSNGGPARLLYRQEGFHVLDPVLAAPQMLPRVATSMVDRSSSSGWLLCLNAYLSRLPEVSEAGPGELRRARVWDARTGSLLGEAPIEEDGSFFLEVPADRLLRLELLDSERDVVAALESGIWVRPNEHRGCIGCHEPAYLAAENRRPQALKRPPVPVGVSPSPLYTRRGPEGPEHE